VARLALVAQHDGNDWLAVVTSTTGSLHPDERRDVLAAVDADVGA
jgi:hypothetical protein